MKTMQTRTSALLVLILLALSAVTWAQDDSTTDPTTDPQEEKKKPAIQNEITVGLYYQDEDADRFGKYSGLTDDDWYGLLDFRLEKRPVWDSGDTVRWRLQGYRLGLDSRRLEFDYNQQGTQRFRFDYRSIPNNRFSDARTPYRARAAGLWVLTPDWQVAPGSSNTRGFLNLEESLVNLSVDTRRQRMALAYERKLGANWLLDIDFRHELKEGGRSLAGIFGHSGGNPRAVILAAPVDWTTDTVEAMFRFNNSRMQFGAGIYASFFSNNESTLTFQNAYGYRNGWAPGVEFPDSYGRLALAPDNRYVQFKAYGGMNFSARTRLTADVAWGRMEQDERLLPYSVNPTLVVHTPVPLESLDAEVETAMVNLRLTSQLARRLGLRVNYHYDDRDNKTPQAIYPYIGGDSQDQKRFQDGRINLPYSYTRHRADAVGTWRFARSSRLKAGVEYSDYRRDFQEVRDSDELTWLAGISLRGWARGSLNLDYRSSSRDVSEYTGNLPFLSSHVPGTVEPDEWDNHPLLRKYYLTGRDRDQLRFRADFIPSDQVNLGLAASFAEDDYDDGYFGLNAAEVSSLSLDAGFHPSENIALTGYYTWEEYDAEQSGRSFFNEGSAEDPDNNWFVDSSDKVDTWNIALSFGGLGAETLGSGFDLGFDYTVSDTRSRITVTAASAATGPLPDLQAEMRSFSLWAAMGTGENSSLRFSAENARLDTADWGLDGVLPDTLANVLTLGESSANYDLWLITGSWTYRF